MQVHSDQIFALTKYTPYLTLTGELWGIDFEYFGEMCILYTYVCIENSIVHGNEYCGQTM